MHANLCSMERDTFAAPVGASPAAALREPAPDALRLERLVAAARTGDGRAEEALYRLHAADVLRLATRLLRSRQEAEDVAQDAFLAALRDLPQLREGAAFRGWLMQITVRLVHRRFRARKWRQIFGLRCGEDDARLAQLASGADASERAELALLDAALDAAAPSDKLLWMLRHVEGWALDEIAAQCSISLATVKRRIARAGAVVALHVGPQSPLTQEETS